MPVYRYLLTCFAGTLFVVTSAAAQPHPTSGAEFPAAKFDSLDRIAFYLWQYDSFAWATSDKLNAEAAKLDKATLARLGSEWFCFKRDSVWHAVYGRFDPAADKYDAVLHYMSSGGQIVRASEFVDAGVADRFGRAIALTVKRLPQQARESNIRFNSYVRDRSDGGLDVWIVPAWQPNGWLLYGVEFQYTLDHEGRTVRDSLVRLGAIKGARPDSKATIHLVHGDAPGIPTVAEILFIRLYTKYFAHVRVLTRDWLSELMYQDGAPKAWIHALREAPASATVRQ